MSVGGISLIKYNFINQVHPGNIRSKEMTGLHKKLFTLKKNKLSKANENVDLYDPVGDYKLGLG